jgi:hypothetical protein
MKSWNCLITSAIAALSLAPSMAPAQQVAPTASTNFTEVSRKQINRGDHTDTYVLVKPPILAKAPPSQAPTPPTKDQLATAARQASKPSVGLTLTGIVYLGAQPITELTWTNDAGDKHYRAYSNIDFRVFTQMSVIETDDMVFQWFPFISASDGQPDLTAHATALRQLSAAGNKADYVMEGTTADIKANANVLDALDYLHATYQVNKTQLLAAYQKLQADNAAQLLQAENAPKPNATIYYWPRAGTKP